MDPKQSHPQDRCPNLKACLLKSWQPVTTYGSNIIIFFILGLVLLVIGAILTVVNSTVLEYTIRYDDTCGNLTSCNVTLKLDKKMIAPIYFYYGLDGFFQNHRNYIKSKDNAQLEGEERTVQQVKTSCSPVIYNANISSITNVSIGNVTLDPNGVANPCGLIAKSFFNDTYTMIRPNTSAVFLNETRIAWASDREKFQNSANALQTQWMNLTNEHFIVWMRASGLSDFQKLWARIETDLDAGEYTIVIQNNYHYSGFKGQRNVAVSTLGPFGGRNDFLAIAYYAIGGFCWLISGFFLVRYLIVKKEKMN